MLTSDQIRAARALKNWSQAELAEKVGMSVPSIGNIESEKHKPTPATQQKITEVFEGAGIEFIDGGVRHIPDIVTIYDGPDCYLKLLDDAYYALAEDKNELLFWAANEERCSEQVIEKTRLLRKAGIPMRFLICEGDTYCLGSLDEYRWLKKDLFVTSDVKLTFADRVAYLLASEDHQKIVVLKDINIARDSRRIFNFIWDLSSGPNQSTAEISYEALEIKNAG
jgi:transcriptional regulator with XRE-family HTH domain